MLWAVVAFALALGLGLGSGLTATSALAPYLALATVALLESAVGALRAWLEQGGGRSPGEPLVNLAVVLLLAWLGEHLSLGRVGTVSSLTLALEMALVVRILTHLEAIRAARRAAVADQDTGARKAGSWA
ncbi:MAG: DUF1290 domain-containing protein [Armatimonadetes bacterium]|nr:DUF1290 domain-containing protein [Armatimonadota bacterium]